MVGGGEVWRRERGGSGMGSGIDIIGMGKVVEGGMGKIWGNNGIGGRGRIKRVVRKGCRRWEE